jgi:hypothetical protein
MTPPVETIPRRRARNRVWSLRYKPGLWGILLVHNILCTYKFLKTFILLYYTQWHWILSYDNSTAMYKLLKTLHPGGIRTRDLLFWRRTRWALCQHIYINTYVSCTCVCTYVCFLCCISPDRQRDAKKGWKSTPRKKQRLIKCRSRRSH